jgi:hypothetical protein
MSGRWNQLSPFTKLLAFAVAAILAFAMAASIGAVAAFMVSGNLSSPTGEEARPQGSSPTGEQGTSAQPKQANAESSQQQNAGGRPDQATTQDGQGTYVDEVGEIQADSVDAFLHNHEKLLRYDALNSGDIEKMQADQAALKGFTDQASSLSVPQEYTKHNEVFLSAIEELHQAARLAYALAADPISATQSDFEHYDRLVDEAAADLQRSNEILGKDYTTIEGMQEVSAAQ